ncbi:hypothetical protein JCM11251_005503 [Rhodosporidiobolus azoricus]
MPRSPEPQLVPRAPSLAKDDTPPSESSSEEEGETPQEEEYVVEEIRASRFDDYAGGRRYLVKWKGYGEDEKTWEPAENLENCRDLVIEFEAQKKAREEKRQAQATGPSFLSRKQKLKEPRACLPSAGDSSEDEGRSMKELDARREKAKKKSRESGSAQLKAGRIEDAVADKIEKRAERKADKKAPSSKGESIAESPKKQKEVVKGDQRRAAAKVDKDKAPVKRPRESPETYSSSVVKKIKKSTPRVVQDTSDDEPVAPPAPRKSTSQGPARIASSAPLTTVPAAPPSNSSSSTAPSPPAAPPKSTQSRFPAAAPKPAAAATTGRPGPGRAASPAVPARAIPQGINPAVKESLKALNFKKRAPSPASVPPARGVRFYENDANSPASGPPNGYASPAPYPAPYNGAAAAPPQPPAQPEPQADPQPQPAAVDPPAQSAEEQAEQKKRLKDQLIGHEERLRRTAWYNSNPIFEEVGALPLLCARALHLEPHQIMRMKNRGVAVLFDVTRSEVAKGEGHAMGYCLLAVGAETPKVMTKVVSVCVHRTFDIEQVEQLYCELTNLSSHTVEFFHFGEQLLLTPIFAAGYLVVMTRTALQQSAAVERFCGNVRDPSRSMVRLTAHPATLAFVRASLPNWNGALALLQDNGIDPVKKQELKLDSAFINIETGVLLSGQQIYPPLPTVTEESELDEITSYLNWTRSTQPEAYRRFIVVSGEAIPEQKARLRMKGVEMHTWGSLTELIQSNFFG